jgi:hypothetical protein
MTPEMKAAIQEYGTTLRKQGFKAAELVIQKYEGQFKDFRKWAYALGQMIRTGNIKKKKGYTGDG